jgi:MarR family transcriptional regulator, transcriptional regulator for hemolysin
LANRSPGESKKTREDLLQELMEQMMCVGKQIHHGARQIHHNAMLHGASFSPPQARLLFAIAGKKEEGISVKELAEKTEVTPGAITQFVDALVKKQLVRRDEDAKDRRIVRLTLTDNARNQFVEFRSTFISSAARAFDALSDDELARIIGLLAKVCAHTNPR